MVKICNASHMEMPSYASKVTVIGVTCVLVVHFRSSDTFKVCKLA